MDKSIILKFDKKEIYWEIGESLIRKLESEGIVKEVFPLHGKVSLMHHKAMSIQRLYKIIFAAFTDDVMRKQLLRSWALNWWDFTKQPIDEICSYYGMKVDRILCLLELCS